MNHEKDVLSALLLFHQRSSLTGHLLKEDGDVGSIVDDSVVSSSKKTEITQNYVKELSFDQSLLTCAVCGERKYYPSSHAQVTEMKLKDLELLKLSPEKVDTIDATLAEFRAVHSVYPFEGPDRWHLHREFVIVPPEDVDEINYPTHSVLGTLAISKL